MSYEADPIATKPGIIERFLDEMYVWLFLCFIISADIASSVVLKMPLISLRLDLLDKSVPIGSLLLFLSGFSLVLLFAWRIRYWFYMLTRPFLDLGKWLRPKKSNEEFVREWRERHEGSVLDFRLLEYAIKNDHSALYDIYRRYKKDRREVRWTILFIFITGVLLAITPFLTVSTLHALLFVPYAINPWWGALLAVPLMLYGAHAPSDVESYVYVGREIAQLIDPTKNPSGPGRFER